MSILPIMNGLRFSGKRLSLEGAMTAMDSRVGDEVEIGDKRAVASSSKVSHCQRLRAAAVVCSEHLRRTKAVSNSLVLLEKDRLRCDSEGVEAIRVDN